ncbi:MAG: FprA family A-type flavoprotein [Candidatus Methylarchaceae archaeon HK02M1]|nr:FprA family A-type flavoprotein [Candidatus Methylarchaceae archaeon HK02M1]
MTSIELAKDVYWVGAVDWDLRNFHGHETRRGTTYNAYLIIDDKTTLVDTVKYTFSSELKKNIRELTNPKKIDYIVINHIEIDHSSSLPKVMEFAKNAKIIATRNGKEGLMEYYGEDWDIETVKTGDELKIGRRTLRFVEAPMLHWPDSMFTYLVEDEILMPNDAFGQHLASSQRFDDEVHESVLMDEAAKYYANILMPFASLIIKKIDELSDLGVKPRMIAPSHGIIWRSNPDRIVDSYLVWSKGETKKKAVIVYDTMWGSTQKMAYAILEAMAKHGIDIHLFHMRRSDISEIMKEILEAKAVIIGSPTINHSMFPTISAFLNYITGLRPKGKIWASFGSYGWGGGAVRDINQSLKKAGFELLEPSLEVRYVPDEEKLQKCREFGEGIAEKIE